MRLTSLAALLLIWFSAQASAEGLTARWLGVAGLSITDGETTLLFDPVFTKPTWRHWLLGEEFRSNPERVKSGLESAGIKTAQAVFASHCHFDHVSDIGAVSGATGAVVRGGPSLKRIALKDPQEKARFEEIEDKKEFMVGKFKVIPFRRQHAAILHKLAIKFLPGAVPEDFHFGFYQFKEGEVWAFRIEHPDGALIVDQGSHFFEPHAEFARKTDAYFVGIANKKSLEDLVDHNMKRIEAPMIVPLHFDFFLYQHDQLEALRLPGNQIGEIRERLQKAYDPAPNFFVPKRNEEIRIPKKIMPAANPAPSPASGV
jgi:L-ascorbate metabolism protein UlaG (beta-lactamase superfamily)